MTRRLRILHVDPEWHWGGGEAQVLGLTRYLHQAGHISHVATPLHGVLAQRLQHDNLAVQPLSIRNHLDGLAGWRLRRLVRRERYDLVHFHTARAHALSPWLHALPVRRLVTRRMDYPIKARWLSRFLYGKQVDMVVAISSGVAAALGDAHISARAIRIIPSGIDTKQFLPTASQRMAIRRQYRLGEDTTVVLMAGALTKRKSPHTLIGAAAQLHSRRQQSQHPRQNGQALSPHYLICGDGPLRQELEARVQALGLASVFHFAGFCRDVPAYLSAADIFVHTPVWEGLGVAVIEALAAGLPVVASRVGGIPELITDRETGLLIPAQDSSALCNALLQCVLHPDWAKTLGAHGQATVRTHFDIETTARANEALYYELLAAAP